MQPMNQVRSVNGAVTSTVAAAFQRGLIQALLTFAVTALTTRQVEVNNVQVSWESALIAGAIAGLGILVTRFGGEGAYDGFRQSAGTVNSSDVQTNAPAVVVAPVDSINGRT